jgi:cytochrome c oxidase subunit 2
MNDVPSPLLPHSPQAAAIAELFDAVFILSAAIFAIVVVLVVFALLRYRARPGVGEPTRRFGSTPLEIVWTAVPLVVVIVLFGATLKIMRVADPPLPPDREPDVVVIGHQWWWEIRYPQTGVVTANELHMPVGKPLLVRLQAADVIHSFWLPQLGPKMDAIPGRTNHIWLQADTTGTFRGACYEFCGTQHAWMRLRAEAQTQADFDAWQQAQLVKPAPPEAGVAAEGATLFRDLACDKCHAIAGLTEDVQIAPNLTHFASRATLGAGIMENNTANVTTWLTNPQAVKSGSHMPNFNLQEADVKRLVAYMETLR